MGNPLTIFPDYDDEVPSLITNRHSIKLLAAYQVLVDSGLFKDIVINELQLDLNREMKINNELIELYLGEGALAKPQHKTTFICNEEDWALLRKAFPEAGFITYLPGFILKLVADECRRNNIESAFDRHDTNLESVTRVLSSIKLVGDGHKSTE
jgi:hypothetical protein